MLTPRAGLVLFCAALLVVYAAVPLLVDATAMPASEFRTLAGLCLLAVAAIAIGSRLPLLDGRFAPGAPRIAIDATTFTVVTWTGFAAFVAVTLATAPSIPLLDALRGGDADALSQARGDFLKGREGAGIALLYLSTFLINTVLPYSVVLLYHWRSPWRHVLAAAFFLFCISFLQKTLFLNLALPLVAYFAIAGRLRASTAAAGAAASLAIVLAATYLSLGGTGDPGLVDAGNEPYFSAAHVPSDPIRYFAWRAVAVPVFTATDTLLVHDALFEGRPLAGATSTLISLLFGLERVNIERHVFEHQFGSWNEIANANAVFVVDAYVNFGLAGVLGFGLLVGQVMRWFRLSADVGFQSLWPLFAFVLFSAPLIGMLFSNGFLYMMFHALFLSIVPRRSAGA